MRLVLLFASILPVLVGQNGAAIYKERCASCHDAPEGRVPSLQTLKGMTGQALYIALTSGAMKTQAAGLSTGEIFALLGYIGPTGASGPPVSLEKTCPGDQAFDARSTPQWNGWSSSVSGSRFQDSAAAALAVDDIPKLKLKWAFQLGATAVARSQPITVGGRVFITTPGGVVYSLDAKTGCTHWGFKASTGIRAGATLGDAGGVPAIFFPDGGGTVYALRADSGALIWKIRPVDHWASTATATPRFYKGVIYQPYSSIEEALGPDPAFQCCTFRGNVVALNAATGEKMWQSFTIVEPPQPTRKSAKGTQQFGPSGAGVWSTPTIDEKLGRLYVATGDNYSDPPTNTSDAVLAMELATGRMVWSRQLTERDAYNVGCSTPEKTNCPEEAGPDFDFGQPPIMVSLSGDRRALVIGQKSGMVHAINPDANGEILWQTRAGKGGMLGGSQWGSASDGSNVYVAISDIGIGGVADASVPGGFRLVLDPRIGGGLHALNVSSGQIVWSAKPIPCPDERTDCSPAQSAAVTVIPGAVFSGSVDGHLRAYSTSTGEVLWDTNTAREFETVNGGKAKGGSMDAAGPAVVNGMVFVNSGYNQWGGMGGNVLLAFSVDGK